MSLEVRRPGLLTMVQDLGRPGFRDQGVTSAGALDVVSFTIANQLVGNAPNSAALEITLLGPTLRFLRPSRIAVTGADIDVQADGVPLPMWRPLDLPAPVELRLGECRRGARAYLAVGGGVHADKVLGSSSTDLRGGFGGAGGRALTAGSTLRLGTPSPASSFNRVVPWFVDPRPDLDLDAPALARVMAGADDLEHPSALFDAAWTVSNDSNRQALRLAGPALCLRAPVERVSEPVAEGTIQLPPGGAPIVLLADAQTVGGYPRIGHVARVDLPRLAQLRPGESVRFVATTLEEAERLACERRARLARIAQAIKQRLG